MTACSTWLPVRLAACLLSLWLFACAARTPAPPAAHAAQHGTRMSAQLLFERGRTFAVAGDLSRAQQYLKLAIAAGYPEQQAFVVLVQVCVAASRLREALEYARSFLGRHPDAWRLRCLVAAIDSALGRHRSAADQLRRVIAQRPDAAHAHYLLGVVERDGNHDDSAARASFEAYLAREPRGVFAAETSAWLREHPDAAATGARTGQATP